MTDSSDSSAPQALEKELNTGSWAQPGTQTGRQKANYIQDEKKKEEEQQHGTRKYSEQSETPSQLSRLTKAQIESSREQMGGCHSTLLIRRAAAASRTHASALSHTRNSSSVLRPAPGAQPVLARSASKQTQRYEEQTDSFRGDGIGAWVKTVKGSEDESPAGRSIYYGPELSLSAGCRQLERKQRNFTSAGSRKLYFDTHALVCLLEENGFTTQQAEIIVFALVKITEANMDIVYKDMVTKMQQEITLQQIMSQIASVKKDMFILEKSEFSALRAENEKVKLELHRLKQQIMDEVVKVQTDTKLDFNLEKSRVKELYSLNERKLLEMRTEMVALHAQQDRAVTQTDRKIDTEVAGLKTMLESHKLDNIKYLAGSVFTCLTVALGFYRLWI
ncbi:mitochondrial calcium uniporter regulator 1-like [Saccopteryx leptura]|uniref:mitochondrial calcium uniporter regulator 1-like n=1 Tax=Saccopteryx leptura TaxID=249018 RepID=UPI00339C1B7F